MFKFNFHKSGTDGALQEEVYPEKVELTWIKPSVHHVTEEHKARVVNLKACDKNIDNFDWCDVTLQFVSSHGLKKNLDTAEPSFSPALCHTDLIPSVYEGGLKIWECTWDLLKHLKDTRIEFSGKRVLELGCGAGLLGLAAAAKGASVVFQDYNVEVIDCWTIPNILLNYGCIFDLSDPDVEQSIDLSTINAKLKFYSGDWADFGDLVISDNEKFDVILSCETIYNPDNQKKLLEVFINCLKLDGVVLIAAKSHYFGVGGGTFDFCKLVEGDTHFTVDSITCHSEGVKREILTLRRRSHHSGPEDQ